MKKVIRYRVRRIHVPQHHIKRYIRKNGTHVRGYDVRGYYIPAHTVTYFPPKRKIRERKSIPIERKKLDRLGRQLAKLPSSEKVTIVKRFTWYQPLRGEKRRKLVIEKSHTGNVFTRHIDTGKQLIRSKLEYVVVKPSFLLESEFNEFLVRNIESDFKRFQNSNYQSFTASVQLAVGGHWVDRYTAWLSEDGRISRGANFYAMSKNIPKRDLQRTEDTIAALVSQRITAFEIELQSHLYQYGVVHAESKSQREKSANLRELKQWRID